MANTSNALFAQADINGDQQLDLNEFRNSFGAAGAAAGGGYNSALYGSSSSSSYESSGNNGALGGDLAYVGTGIGTAGYGASSYESSSYNASVGNADGYGLGSAGSAIELSDADSSATRIQTTATQQYETDSQGLFKDPNPQIIRRAAASSDMTYTQNIKVRFLQPPPIPPPGPLIIKEVRPPQPPPPPALRIRQQAPPLPQLPPLILRERPPIPPASIASQTVIRKLAALAIPPRSVIIERLPALPAKPRDIIIERWIPYGAAAKRKTIIQRAAAAREYPRPRNIIIQYEAAQVRIVRQFQRLGVTQENPAEYVQRYGTSLLDAQALLQQARAAGVVEDISAPTIGGIVSGNLNTGTAGLGSTSTYESSSYSGTTDQLDNRTGLEGAAAAAAAAYESSSYAASGNISGLEEAIAEINQGAASTYASSSYNSSTDDAFAAADQNQDGVLSREEFRTAGY